jgi:hypothetical protein
MFEVFVDGYMPFGGRTKQTLGFPSLFRRFPDFPLSNHGFKAFIDRLFRFVGRTNWIPRQLRAAGRTAIPSPAEQQIVEVVLCSGVVAINCLKLRHK